MGRLQAPGAGAARGGEWHCPSVLKCVRLYRKLDPVRAHGRDAMAFRPTTTARLRSAFLPLIDWLRNRDLLTYRRVRLVRCDRAEPQWGAEIPLNVSEAGEEDLNILGRAQHVATTDWATRQERGVVCLVARSGSSPVGYLWITRSAELMIEVHHVVDVSRDPGGAYMFDGYVLPAHRRKGVLSTLLEESKRWARERNISRLYAAFTRDNHVSERALLRAGFVTVVGDVDMIRVLGWEWKRVRVPSGSRMSEVLRAEGLSARAARPA